MCYKAASYFLRIMVAYTCWLHLDLFILLHFLFQQTAEEAMTPIESTFSLDVNSKLDW